MKRKQIAILLGLTFLATALPVQAQDDPAERKLSRTERKELNKEKEIDQIQIVNDVIANSDFVLEPNQISGNNVNPILNFIMVSGDSLIFQTSRPSDRSKSNNRLTDKTVIGKITSRDFKTDPRNGYHKLKLKMMTDVGIGFKVDMSISPAGNATAWISPFNSSGTLDYQGRIVPWEKSDIFIGPESFDLQGFPWYQNLTWYRYFDQ
jgi:hypothetical protein